MARYISPIGKLVFGSLINAQTNDYGQTRWSAGLRIEEKAGAPIAQAIEEGIKEARAKNPKFPASNKDLRLPIRAAKDKDETGEYVINPDEQVYVFNRKYEVNSKTGEKMRNSPPRIYDATGTLVTDLQEVPFGSMGKVIFDVYCYATPTFAGVQLQLAGFQIAELANRHETLTPIEGGWVSESAQEQDISSILQSA